MKRITKPSFKEKSQSDSDSSAQRDAEFDVLVKIKRDLRLPGKLNSKNIIIQNRYVVQVDGFFPGIRPILVEVYAHQGRMRGSQPNKLMADAMKLSLIRLKKYPKGRAILAVSPTVRNQIENSWRGEALRAHRIELRIVKLTPKMVQKLEHAQKAQYR